MNPHFQALKRQIKRRKRALNGLTGASHWVGISLGISLVYLSAVALGLLPSLMPLWALGLFNLLIGLLGGLRGGLRPIDLAAALFQVDRALGTGETLCTYHEFSGRRARPPFSWRLEQTINTIVVDTAAALPLSRRQRHRLAVILGLVLANLWLGNLSPLHVTPLGLAGLSTTRHDAEETQTQNPSSAPQPLDPRELQQLTMQASQLEKQLRIEVSPVQARTKAAELNTLYQQLREAQKQLWKLPNGASAPSMAHPTDESSQDAQANPSADQQELARRLADARLAAEALQQALDQLKQTLNDPQGQAGGADPEAIRQALERLAQQAPSEEISQSLARAAQAETPQGQRQLIARAQQQLQDLLKQDQQLARAQQQIAQALHEEEGGQRPAPQGTLAQNNGEANQGTNSQGAGSAGDPKPNSPSGIGGKTSASAKGKGEEQQAGGQEMPPGTNGTGDQSSNQSGGDQAGSQDAPDAPGVPTDQSLLQHQLVIARGRLPADAQLQLVMLSKGVPFETVGPAPNGDLTLRYDFAKAEALLKLRGLPQGLRDLIRQYFVTITAEPRQP